MKPLTLDSSKRSQIANNLKYDLNWKKLENITTVIGFIENHKITTFACSAALADKQTFSDQFWVFNLNRKINSKQALISSIRASVHSDSRDLAKS